MAKYAITLDHSTLFGKKFFDFLVGIKCADANNPNIVTINERTSEGKTLKRMMYEGGVMKDSPYNPEFVAMVKQIENELDKGEYTVVTDVKKFIDEL